MAKKPVGAVVQIGERGVEELVLNFLKIFVEINFGDIFQCGGEVLVYFDKVNMVKLFI